MSVAPVLDNIVLFGDSITQGGWETGGFAQRLAAAYSRRLDVINRGYGGYNSTWGIPVFEQIFVNQEETRVHPKCKLLTIWFGANDSCLPGSISTQHVPLPQYKENLKWFVDAIRFPSSPYHSPSTRIVLITPPPIHEASWAAWLQARETPLEMDRSWDHTKSYADAVLEVGKELNVPVFDAWDAIWKAAGTQTESLVMFLSDGLHLTKEGYEIVYNGLIDVISEHYPELHYSKIAEAFPAWDAVDRKDPKGSVVLNYVDL